MTKQNIGILILTSIIVLLPIVAGVFLWERLPAQIPIHWSLSGEIDQYVPKFVAVVVFPLVMLALHWVSFFNRRNREAEPSFIGSSPLLRWYCLPSFTTFR
ncbi:MAG: DUF1648 domain-containing protein [Clostridia bacterium]|nr:DUF1648 domain-containing protein [Clostridia bacterium]